LLSHPTCYRYTEALSLMQRKDPATGTVRLLGKDVLVRGCGMMPGGVDGELGLVLLEGTLRRGCTR
jgi:hypothetical protein